jgi:WhiB family redox-sensing transcriptional regulator
MTLLLELMAPFETHDTMPCTDEDPELFFAESPSDIELAKLICGPCPLRDECLTGALDRREPHGVWGGQLFIAGEIVARKRPRGRPRKIVEPEPAIELPTREVAAA